MKRLIQHIRARLRPAKPVPPVTVPAPVGPARIATPAEQNLAELAFALADAKRAERMADEAASEAYNARSAAEVELRKAIEEMTRP